MDFFFRCCLILFTFFNVLISVGYLFYTKSKYQSYPNLPPGSMGLPYIGESLEFLNAGRRGHPEKFIYDRLTQYASKVFKTSILFQPTMVLCESAGNKFLFSNENKLVTTWWPESVYKVFPSSSQTSSTEESRRMKNMLPNFFKPEALANYIGMMDSIAQKHFESNWQGKEQVLVFPLAKRYTFWVACKVFLSIDDEAQVAKFANPFDVLASGIISIPVDLPGTPFNRAIKAANLIRKELRHIINKRKTNVLDNGASPGQDVLSHMLVATDENGEHMDELNIADKILGLLIGGHDTASSAITFIVKYLSELPHIYEQVLKEQMEIAKTKKPGETLNWRDVQKMKYSWNVACEVMRLSPPLPGAFREALQDFTFNGFCIPKGWKIYWSASAIHRNPEYFPNPENFDPTRFEGNGPIPYTYVPFGGGPRMCPGKEFARLEILVFVHNLVKRFKWQKLIQDEKIIVDPLPKPAKNLPVKLIPHDV